MRALPANELLQIWERAHHRRPLDRAIALLSAANSRETVEELMVLSLGARDELLLNLRMLLFGRAMMLLTDCPQCGEPLELDFDAGQLRMPSSTKDNVYREKEFQVRFRAVNSLDLAAVLSAEAGGRTKSRDLWLALLKRCVVEVNKNDKSANFESLPAEVHESLARAMSEADPQAEVKLPLACAACEHQWECLVDINSYLWEEIHAWAQRTLLDIHRLASAYGWNERQILSLSATRRKIYVDMVGV